MIGALAGLPSIGGLGGGFGGGGFLPMLGFSLLSMFSSQLTTNSMIDTSGFAGIGNDNNSFTNFINQPISNYSTSTANYFGASTGGQSSNRYGSAYNSELASVFGSVGFDPQLVNYVLQSPQQPYPGYPNQNNYAYGQPPAYNGVPAYGGPPPNYAQAYTQEAFSYMTPTPSYPQSNPYVQAYGQQAAGYAASSPVPSYPQQNPYLGAYSQEAAYYGASTPTPTYPQVNPYAQAYAYEAEPDKPGGCTEEGGRAARSRDRHSHKTNAPAHSPGCSFRASASRPHRPVPNSRRRADRGNRRHRN